MSWFYTCFCGAEQGEGGGTCSSQAGGRQCGGLRKVWATWGQGPGSTGCRVSGSWQLRVQGPGGSGCRALCPSKPSIGTAGRRDLQARLTGDPAQHCRERGFLDPFSIGKRRVGGTCHAGHEGVVAMVGGRRAWCRSGGHVTPLFSTCLWRGYLDPIRHSAALAPGYAWAHLNSIPWVFMQTAGTETYTYV